jgi:hypothetical protein
VSGGGDDSSVGGNNPSVGGNASSGGKNNLFVGRNNASGGGNNPSGGGNNAFGGGNDASGGGNFVKVLSAIRDEYGKPCGKLPVPVSAGMFDFLVESEHPNYRITEGAGGLFLEVSAARPAQPPLFGWINLFF